MTPPQPPKLPRLQMQSTSDLIMGQVRQRIMRGVYVQGQQLNEVHLSEELGVSRGPLREALQRLLQEGLLVSIRNKGTFVMTISPQDLREIYQVREVIESDAAKRLLAADDVAKLDELQQLVDRMRDQVGSGSWSELADLDLDFHQRLVDLAGNRRMSSVFGTLVVETRVCMNGLEHFYPDHNLIMLEHQLLVDRIRTGPEAALLESIHEHLNSAMNQLLSVRADIEPSRVG